MPSPYALLNAFGLTQKKILGNFRISKVTSNHQVIKQNQTYTYDVKLVLIRLTKEGSIDDLLIKLNKRRELKVPSQYGNLYVCNIKDWKITGKSLDETLYYLSGKGRAYRV